MTALVVIRHGPTVWNAEGRIQGRSDIALSSKGRAAVRTWRLPPGIGGAGWIQLCSPLIRARETAGLLNSAVEWRVDPTLIEMDWSDWEGRLLSELRGASGDEIAENEALGLDFRPPGGESPREVQGRLMPLLAQLAQSGAPCIAVTHKGVIRALHALASGWDMTGRPPEKLLDACAHGFTLTADGQPQVAALNQALKT